MKTQPMGRRVLCCVCHGARVTVLLLLIAVYFVLFAFTMSTRYATASVAWQPPESLIVRTVLTRPKPILHWSHNLSRLAIMHGGVCFGGNQFNSIRSL